MNYSFFTQRKIQVFRAWIKNFQRQNFGKLENSNLENKVQNSNTTFVYVLRSYYLLVYN